MLLRFSQSMQHSSSSTILVASGPNVSVSPGRDAEENENQSSTGSTTKRITSANCYWHMRL